MAKSTNIEVEERFKNFLLDHKQLKKRLREFNKRYELITESANDFIAILDKDLKYEYINEEFHSKHLGYSKERLIGLKAYSLIHPDDINRVLEYYKESLKKGEGRVELRAKHNDGHYMWVEVKGKKFIDINGEPKTLLVSRDITERKEMERKLKESEEKYRLISENANDLIRVLDENFEFEYINEEVHKRLLGYVKEDLMGKTHLPFLHPEDRRHAVRSTLRNLKRGTGSYQARFKDKTGNYRWYEFSGKIFYDSKGEKKILSIARDISERKLAERKLKESEEKYRLISETAYDLIGVLNKRFKYEYVNENAFQHTLGYSSKDILGKSALKFIHPDDLSQIAKTLFEGFKRGKGEAELRFRHKEGHWVWIESKGQTFFDKNGEIKAIVISRDITQRKLSEQKLKDSEEKYRLISENANDLIRVFNEKFEIEYINESTHKKLLGYSKKDLVGKFGRNIVHPDEYEELKTHLRNVFKTGEGVREGRLKHKNGSWRWFEVKSKMFIDDDGNRKLLSISRDITQRKEAEEKLKRSYEETKFYKDLFMHDIANIYGTVELSTELLDMYKSDLVKNEKEIFDTIKILKSQTNRGSKLISNIQKLSYLEDEKLNLEEIDVNNMLEKAIEFVKKGFLLKKVNITTDTLSGNIYVLANDLLIDVFENILINSIKFTDANIAEVIVRSLMEGDYLKIEFIDKGIGVKDELKKKIFEKGFKTKSKGAGMGLGLYLVKKLVEYYKGKIWVEDRVKGDYSKGSKFIILLKSIKGTQKY